MLIINNANHKFDTYVFGQHDPGKTSMGKTGLKRNYIMEILRKITAKIT
jgi:hypothetical protein